jgi:hypothetical protein
MRSAGAVIAGALICATSLAHASGRCVKVKSGAILYYPLDSPIGRTTKDVVLWWASETAGEDVIGVDATLVTERDGKRVVSGGVDNLRVKRTDVRDAKCPPDWDEGTDDARRDGIAFVDLEWHDGHEAGEIERALIAKELEHGHKEQDGRVCFTLRAIPGISVPVCARPE